MKAMLSETHSEALANPYMPEIVAFGWILAYFDESFLYISDILSAFIQKLFSLHENPI